MKELEDIGVDYLQGFYLHQPEAWENLTVKFGLKGGEDA